MIKGATRNGEAFCYICSMSRKECPVMKNLMFKLKTGNRSVSIMDRNLENLAERIKFFDSINSMLCRKIRLKDGEYLSSDRVAREILEFALK